MNEYVGYKKLVPEGEESPRGTLLWEAAKHLGKPIGEGSNPIFLSLFAHEFVKLLVRAMVYELLTGREAVRRGTGGTDDADDGEQK